jgi:hypothetical protein
MLVGFRFVFRERIVEEHSNRRRIVILKLAVFHAPDKGEQKTSCKEKAEKDEEKQDTHNINAIKLPG